MLLGSATHLDAGMVINSLRFTPAEWGQTGNSPQFLKEVLQSASIPFLRRFLVTCTGQSVVPGTADFSKEKKSMHGLGNVIRVDRIGGPRDTRTGVAMNPLEQRILLQDYETVGDLLDAIKFEMVATMS